jgi:hypothetical protein
MKVNPLKVIENDEQFEELCCAIAQYKYGDFDAQKYGRSGQKQFGIDIKAIDKKSNNERIVIQCKFKRNPPTLTSNSKTERNRIEKEIESELTKTIEGHHIFDCFVYASNIPRDTHLQDFAEKLSTESYTVIIWSQDEIEDDIYRYQRLRDLYTSSSRSDGDEIINTHFIQTLKAEEATAKPNIFQYYTSGSINNVQWYGILNEWDAIREELHVNFLQSIHDSFSSDFIESKIAGLILGEGGAGKSVFLRRIAVTIAKNHKDMVVWWVTDLERFWLRDVNTIDENPQYKHLIIIEDWYRTVGNDYSYSKSMFNWLKRKQHTRVVIGDRTVNNGYKKYITKVNTFRISLDENFTILETITKKLPELHTNIHKLLENETLIRSSPIFVILFVLSELIDSELEVDYDQLVFENVFRELIGKKVAVLENDPTYKGIGKALYVSALLYADANSNYFRVSEKAFLLMAEVLGDNTEISHRIQANKAYPTEFTSLVSFKTLTFKSSHHYNTLQFNHDLIAEKGIAFINETTYELDFTLDTYHTEKLIRACLALQENNAALNLFIWHSNRSKDYDTAKFFNFFKGIIPLLSNTGLRNYLKSLTTEEKKVFTKEILSQKGFFHFPQNIISQALGIWEKDIFGKEKAREILNQKNIFKLRQEIVTQALRIWKNDDFGRKKAKEILSQKEFFKLPHQIVAIALNIRENDSFGRKKAKKILKQKDFYNLDEGIVSNAIKIWEHHKFGRKKARKILKQDNFLDLPFQIVSLSLRICEDDDLGKRRVEEILSQKEFFNLSHEIVSHALRICQNDTIGKQKAAIILNHPKFYELPFEIASRALKICQEHQLGIQKAEEILQQPVFYKVSYQIVSTALKICQNDNIKFEKAKEILILFLDDQRIHPVLIFSAIRAICKLPNQDANDLIHKVYTKIKLQRDDKKFGRLYYDLLYLPLFQVHLHKQRVEFISKQYTYKSNSSKKEQLLRILKCYKEYQEARLDCLNISAVMNRILLNWKKDLAFQKQTNPNKIIDAHITLALTSIQSKSVSKKVAQEIVAYCDENMMLQNRGIYIVSSEIINTDTFEFWE